MAEFTITCTRCGEKLVTRDLQSLREWNSRHDDVCRGER